MPRPNPLQTHIPYRRSILPQEMRKGRREIDPVSGFPCYERTSMRLKKGLVDLTVHYPDIDPKTGAIED